MDYVECFLAGEENTSNSAARQYKGGFPHVSHPIQGLVSSTSTSSSLVSKILIIYVILIIGNKYDNTNHRFSALTQATECPSYKITQKYIRTASPQQIPFAALTAPLILLLVLAVLIINSLLGRPEVLMTLSREFAHFQIAGEEVLSKSYLDGPVSVT